MQFNDEATINGVVLYVENSESDFLHIIIAFNEEIKDLPGICKFELESDSVNRVVRGKEWTIRAQILDIVKWIFIQSFSNERIENSFLYFTELMQIIEHKQITRKNFGMLGEILFAYNLKLDAIVINKWLNTKNRSFDFDIKDHFYEIKTKSIIDNEVVLNLSYNQLTSIGNNTVSLIIVDVNSAKYSIERQKLISHFQNMPLESDTLNSIIECLAVFDYMDFFNFNMLKYSGPEIKMKIHEKIIGINCKVKFDSCQDFVNF